ncbi:MAG: glycosyl hydrolase family 2 [Bacteroidetes bacterium]|nr:glycosyl hydrolase family 2 [Bacteroidota bacterium]
MRLVMLLFIFVSLARPQSRGIDPPNRPDTSLKYVEMPALFSDNMVLQQKSDVPVWGRAAPNQKVTVSASWGRNAETIVKQDSTWMVHLKTIKAGGPYELDITVGDSMIVYENVSLGEVWLCSGQSNMEIPLQGWPPQNPIQNSAEEIDKADYPDIRLFTVARAVSAVPEFNCVGTWSVCTPKTAAKFSAVGYFFGKKLFNELHVPIGLIFSSLGGTKIQPWIAGKYLAQLPSYRPAVREIDSLKGEVVVLNKWIYQHPVIDVGVRDPLHQYDSLNFDDSNCSRTDFDDSAWSSMVLPTDWEATSVGQFDGAVWFRKTIDIPGSWTDSTLVLDLGPIDDMDETWVNGFRVGGLLGGGFWDTPRIYSIPKNVVRDTSLTIAVRVIDTGGGGGIWGGGVKMRIHPEGDTLTCIPLSGEWKFLPVAEYMNSKFYVYGAEGEPFYSRPKVSFPVGPNTPTMLFYGMIAPLIPYRIKGVVWYQGESNSDQPDDYNNYKYLFPLMIGNWRADWHEGDFPFYWVQIAPWNYGAKSKSYVVRDAQRLTLSVPNTGMAVILDIGSLSTVHPPDKQDVGLRLARWALAKNYGKRVVYSGPIYRSMRVKNGKVIISFKYAGGGLVMKPLNGETNFIIAGRDSNFVKAEVKIVGKTLVVCSSSVKHPIAVRYAWGNAEEATLFNKAGLPASTFRTDDWPQ